MEPIKLSKELMGERIRLSTHKLEKASEMFSLIDSERQRLSEFLPWPKFLKQTSDQEDYIKGSHQAWEECSRFDYSLLLKDLDQFIGGIGVHTLSFENNRCEIGYWISEEFEGKGYISEAVSVLEVHLFEMGFNRIEIRGDERNKRSAMVPLRLGYKHEGILRQDVIENGKYRNTNVFSKLKNN